MSLADHRRWKEDRVREIGEEMQILFNEREKLHEEIAQLEKME